MTTNGLVNCNQDLKLENKKYLSIIKQNNTELIKLRNKTNVYEFLIKSLELEIYKIKEKYKSEIEDLKLQLKLYKFKSDISDSRKNSESVNYTK